MAEILGPRAAAVTRELTKVHEDVQTGSLSELAGQYAQAGSIKGEITVVVGRRRPPSPILPGWTVFFGKPLPFMPVKAAAELAADATGVSRHAAYERALSLERRREAVSPDA